MTKFNGVVRLKKELQSKTKAPNFEWMLCFWIVCEM